MHCIGVDIVEIARIEGIVSRRGDQFLKRIYTDREIELCKNRIPSLAARFAAKEAAMKALGISARDAGWLDVETLANSGGQPVIHLHGKAAIRAREIGLSGLAVSLSHSRDSAIASVIGERS